MTKSSSGLKRPLPSKLKNSNTNSPFASSSFSRKRLRVDRTTPVRRQTKGGSRNEFVGPNGKKFHKTFTLNDFDIGKKLGIGKFGKVYLARERKTGYICALKVLYKSRLREHHVEHTLRREIEIMTNIRHPNLTRLFGYFFDGDRVYLILEYCAKGEMFDVLRKEGRFSERRTAMYIHDLAAGLHYLHCKNIIHRDIKPENILLDQQGRIKLTDFGWSVHTGGKRRTMCGTPEYLPPEMVEKETHGTAVDTWALGVLTYEFLVGTSPFEAKSMKKIMTRIKSMDFTYPSCISPLARDFISQLLKKNPTDRLSLEQVPDHPFMLKYLQKKPKPKRSNSTASAVGSDTTVESVGTKTSLGAAKIETHRVNLDEGTIDLLSQKQNEKMSLVSSQKLDYDDSFVELSQNPLCQQSSKNSLLLHMDE